ncbi:MAG: hypothetical protein KIS92_13825 [Planctomycetota bacterium]|nr:hypothetical protein [Planctomycetota bacterium]
MKARLLSGMAGVGVSILLGTAIFGAMRGCSAENAPPDPEAFQKDKERVYQTVSADDEAGFTRMPAPKPGEWLSLYRESPQPLEKFKSQARIRPTPERRTIVLQPLGPFTDDQKKMLQAMKAYAEAFYQLPARVEDPMPAVPKEFEEDPDWVRMVPINHRHDGYTRQCNADTILEKSLSKKVPKDAVLYLGITLEDLYVPSMNYVFGLGSFDKRVGVYSLIRYFPEFWGMTRKEGDERLALLRACKVLNHEAGHIFGLKHCIFYQCSMNGSNSLKETDAAPIHFCPVCHRKILWSIGFDPLKRYTDLEAFYKTNAMKDEAAWIAARIEHWKKVQQAESAQKDE